MKRQVKRKRLQIAVTVICAILIIVCAFIAVFPHSHNSCNSECIVCAMADLFREFFFAVVFSAAIYRSLDRENDLTDEYSSVFTMRMFSPVDLRVKLSD